MILWLAPRRPSSHQRPALFQRVAAPIGLLGLVADHMRERRLGDLAREMRLIARPISEGRAEAVNGDALDAPSGAKPFPSPYWRAACRRAGRGRRICRFSLRRAFRVSPAHGSDSGTRCARPAFIRAAGIVQTFVAMSISDQRAPRTSPERVAVRMQNSKAIAACASRSRSLATKAGTSRIGHRRMMAARELLALWQELVQMPAPARRIGFVPDDGLAPAPRPERPQCARATREAVSGFPSRGVAGRTEPPRVNLVDRPGADRRGIYSQASCAHCARCFALRHPPPWSRLRRAAAPQKSSFWIAPPGPRPAA